MMGEKWEGSGGRKEKEWWRSIRGREKKDDGEVGK